MQWMEKGSGDKEVTEEMDESTERGGEGEREKDKQFI